MDLPIPAAAAALATGQTYADASCVNRADRPKYPYPFLDGVVSLLDRARDRADWH
jgi:hypothetical protein